VRSRPSLSKPIGFDDIQNPHVLTVEAVAALLECSASTVEEHASRGDIPGLKFGRSWVFPVQALFRRLNEMAESEAARRREAPQPLAVLGGAVQAGMGRRRKPLPRLPTLPPEFFEGIEEAEARARMKQRGQTRNNDRGIDKV
jgi:excisionase family DNA binding protein